VLRNLQHMYFSQPTTGCWKKHAIFRSLTYLLCSKIGRTKLIISNASFCRVLLSRRLIDDSLCAASICQMELTSPPWQHRKNTQPLHQKAASNCKSQKHAEICTLFAYKLICCHIVCVFSWPDSHCSMKN
jgi:hypothetical protein